MIKQNPNSPIQINNLDFTQNPNKFSDSFQTRDTFEKTNFRNQWCLRRIYQGRGGERSSDGIEREDVEESRRSRRATAFSSFGDDGPVYFPRATNPWSAHNMPTLTARFFYLHSFLLIFIPLWSLCCYLFHANSDPYIYIKKLDYFLFLFSRAEEEQKVKQKQKGVDFGNLTDRFWGV